jgi:hypothetical protein
MRSTPRQLVPLLGGDNELLGVILDIKTNGSPTPRRLGVPYNTPGQAATPA